MKKNTVLNRSRLILINLFFFAVTLLRKNIVLAVENGEFRNINHSKFEHIKEIKNAKPTKNQGINFVESKSKTKEELYDYLKKKNNQKNLSWNTLNFLGENNSLTLYKLQKSLKPKTKKKIIKNSSLNDLTRTTKIISQNLKYQQLKKLPIQTKNLAKLEHFKTGLELAKIGKGYYSEFNEVSYLKTNNLRNKNVKVLSAPPLYNNALVFNHCSSLFFKNNLKRFYTPEYFTIHRILYPINRKDSRYLEHLPLLQEGKYLKLNETFNALMIIDNIKFFNNRDKQEEILMIMLKNDLILNSSNLQLYKITKFKEILSKLNPYENALKFHIKRLSDSEHRVKIQKIKPKKLFKFLKPLKIPSKREIRDACVDGITQIFNFKRWAKQNIQRPFTKFVRSKTGNFFFYDPHVKPFIRKYGFYKLIKKSNLFSIKNESVESSLYRFKNYNRISYNEIHDFSKIQNFDKCESNRSLILPENFYKKNVKFLPQQYIFKNFNEQNNIILQKTYYAKKKRWFNVLDKYFSKNKNLINGLHYLEILIPQSFLHQKKPNTEKILFKKILKYDKKSIEHRNSILSKSFRLFPFYHKVENDIFNEKKIKFGILKKKNLPVFFIGPLLNKQNLQISNSCGYSLGYLKIGKQKMYINPATGLLSYFLNEKKEMFLGNDLNTVFGIYKGQGYYQDERNIKYFFKDIYKEVHSYYFDKNFSPDGFPKSRCNQYFYKNEIFYEIEYVKLKKSLGLWKDIRQKFRHLGKRWYPLEKK
jgi:hypothetical protein